MQPNVQIYLNKFRHNVETVKSKMDPNGVGVFGVSKVFCGDPYLAGIFQSVGLKGIADSRIENLKKLQHLHIPKVLLRLPMTSEIDDLVDYVDISLNSEIQTVKRISQAAVQRGKVHQIIVMVDLGDLREGIFDREELDRFMQEAVNLPGIQVVGIGTNLTCFGAIIPKTSHMETLVSIGEEINVRYGIQLQYLSGGNSSTYYLVEQADFPKAINNLRIGEIFVCGNETAYSTRVPNTYDDVFVLEVEIVELKEKPSLPIGESGVDAFGNQPVYEDKGPMLRGICAVGRQDVHADDLIPLMDGVEILGCSSDHLILDLTHSMKKLAVGDTLQFKLKYGGILSVMTSPYVEKIYFE